MKISLNEIFLPVVTEKILIQNILTTYVCPFQRGYFYLNHPYLPPLFLRLLTLFNMNKNEF